MTISLLENKNTILITFASALLLILVIIYFTIRIEGQARENAGWVIHTHQVISESERLSSLLKDAQRGVRGYLLLQDKQYLEPYYHAKSSTLNSLRQLGELTADQVIQQERLRVLRGLIGESFTYWDSTLYLNDTKSFSLALERMKTGNSKRLLELTTSNIDVFQKFEQVLLKDRQTRYESSQQKATFTTIGGGLLSIGLLIFTFTLLQNRLFRKEQLGSILEKQVQERTNELQVSLDQVKDYNDRLSKSEETFRTMAEAVPVKIWMSNKLGLNEYFNPPFLSFLGKTLQEALTYDWTKNIHPEDLQAYRQVYIEAFKEEQAFEAEFRLRQHDDKYQWVIDRAVPRIKEGEFIGYIGSLLDVSSLKESQQALSNTVHALENYQKVLDRSALISITDIKGTILHVNELFCQVAKYSREELIGQNHRIIKSDYHPREFFRQMWSTIARGGLWRGEICNRAKDGSLYWVDTIINPIYNQKGKIEQYISIRYEISARKEGEEHLRRQNEELLKINAELDAFVYRAGHDLRAPLVSVLGLINIAQLETSPQKKDEYMQLMSKSMHKLDSFIRDIIDFSRNARTELSLKPVHFGPLLEEVKSNLTYMQHQPIELIVELEEHAFFVSDPKRLSIIFSNLLSNAYRYANPAQTHSYVRIGVLVTEKGAIITITDNGIGIGSEHIDKIFNMFYRASDSKTGSGLGLYIVKETLQVLEGSIKVSSTLGEGTTFTVRVPNKARPLEGETDLTGRVGMAGQG